MLRHTVNSCLQIGGEVADLVAGNGLEHDRRS
jgi:hypothetical protein